MIQNITGEDYSASEYYQSQEFKFNHQSMVILESTEDVLVEKKFENLKGNNLFFIVDENEK